MTCWPSSMRSAWIAWCSSATRWAAWWDCLDWLSQVAALIPDCVLTTIPVGHRIHQNAPAEFLAAVRDFVG